MRMKPETEMSLVMQYVLLAITSLLRKDPVLYHCFVQSYSEYTCVQILLPDAEVEPSINNGDVIELAPLNISSTQDKDTCPQCSTSKKNSLVNYDELNIVTEPLALPQPESSKFTELNGFIA